METFLPVSRYPAVTEPRAGLDPGRTQAHQVPCL